MKEHKHHEMIDNRMVQVTRKEGITRVIQRKGEAGRVGQPGHMKAKPDQKADFKRMGESLTPRRA